MALEFGGECRGNATASAIFFKLLQQRERETNGAGVALKGQLLDLDDNILVLFF